MTKLTSFSIVDTFHADAIRAGCVHVDGNGSRSIFEADRAAIEALRASLAAELATAKGAHIRSLKAAISRLEGAVVGLWSDDEHRAYRDARRAAAAR